MIDIQGIRADPQGVAEKLNKRQLNGFAVVDRILSLDREHRALLREAETLRCQRNKTSKEIASLKSSGMDTSKNVEAIRNVRTRLTEIECRLRQCSCQREQILAGLPNLPHEAVPCSLNKSDKVVVRTFGTPSQLHFPFRSHVELGKQIGLFDFERGTKIAGARFPLYIDMGAQLETALINLMLEMNVKEKGYTQVMPPILVNHETAFGAGNLPKFEDQLFYCEKDRFYLVPTAEVPLTGLHREETLDEADLPLRYTAFTPCFRREAGAAGVGERGLIRMHQFNKVELYKFSTPEHSYEELEALVADVEDILRRLQLHYRVTLLVTSDLGQAAAKTYDVEVWLPAQNAYYEVSSCSNCEDYQARRANIRYLRHSDGKTRFVHTLNGSGLATSRLLAALLENNQQPDGSVIIPSALRRYLSVDRLIPKRHS